MTDTPAHGETAPVGPPGRSGKRLLRFLAITVLVVMGFILTAGLLAAMVAHFEVSQADLRRWQVVSGGVTIENDKFTMPDGNVEIKAIFEKDVAPATPAPTATPKPESSPTPAPAAAAKPNSSPTPAPAATAKPESSPALAPTATAKPDSSPTPAPTAPATKLPVWWVALPIVGGVALAGVFVMRKKKRRK